MSSYGKQIAVLRSLVPSGPSPGPIQARRLSGNDKKQAWLLKQTPSMRFSVDSRIRYENGSVDANRSMRFRSYENAYI